MPDDGHLASDATFMLSVHGGAPVAVTVTAASTAYNEFPSDLIRNINASLAAAGIQNVTAELVDNDGLQLRTTDLVQGVPSLHVTAAAGNSAVTKLGLAIDQTSSGTQALAVAADTLVSRALVDRFNLQGTTTLDAAGVDGSANYGLVGVMVAGGTGTATETIRIAPNGTTLARLENQIDQFNSSTSPYSITYSGTAS